MTAQITPLRRPGREPPATPPPSPILTGNVTLTDKERAAMLEIHNIGQQLGRISSGSSTPASQHARIPDLSMKMVEAVNRLAAANNERSGGHE